MKIGFEHIYAVNKWQSNSKVHPLTCGNNSNHKILKVVVSKGFVFLSCPDCSYVQDWVPDIVIKEDEPEFHFTFSKD